MEKEDVKQPFNCELATLELYKCKWTVCGFETPLKTRFSEHFRVFHEQIDGFLPTTLELHQCKTCTFNTYSLLLFTSHELTCNEKLQGLDQKWDQNVSSKELVPLCKITNVRTVKTRLKRPALQHRNWFKCTLCTFQTKSKQLLKRHVGLVHPKHKNSVNATEEWLQCDHCIEKFLPHLRDHIYFKRADVDKIQYTPKTNLIKPPNKRKAVAKKDIKCDVCPELFRSKRSLQSHKRYQHGITWFKCNVCAYKARVEHLLNRHISSKHPEAKKIYLFDCDLCMKKFENERNLVKHIQRVHRIERPRDVKWYQCDKCSFCTTFQSYMQDHFRTHTSEKLSSYVCGKCKRQFKTKSGLQTHILFKHNEHWYNCDKCTFKTKLKGWFNRHILSEHSSLMLC